MVFKYGYENIYIWMSIYIYQKIEILEIEILDFFQKFLYFLFMLMLYINFWHFGKMRYVNLTFSDKNGTFFIKKIFDNFWK